MLQPRLIPGNNDHNIAFYRNRNKMRFDRNIDFNPEMPELPEWVDLRELIPAEKIESYITLCRRAIQLTTRILLLPPEKSYLRSIVYMDGKIPHGNKPTGGFARIEGNNFHGSLDIRDFDIRKEGMACLGEDRVYSRMGNVASVSGFITLNEDRYYHLQNGANSTVVDMGGEFPERIATPDFVERWIEDVLVPLEGDVKARAYEWFGDGKTDPDSYDRIV